MKLSRAFPRCHGIDLISWEAIMNKFVSSIAIAAVMAFAGAGQANAQSQTMKRVTAGEPAKLQGAMTQAQARQVCKTQLAGGRDSKSAMRKKMDFCINEQMQGR